MDALMIDELLALRYETITQELFDQKFADFRRNFNNQLNNTIRNMLSDQNLPEIGNGYCRLTYLIIRKRVVTT